MSDYYILSSSGELYHYGVRGMKWGKRKAILRPLSTRGWRSNKNRGDMNNPAISNASDANRKAPEEKAARVAKAKKAVKIGAAVVGTALAAYGAYKVSRALKNKAYRVAHARGVQAASKFMEGYHSKNAGADVMRKAGNIGRYLSESNHDYAARSSRTTAAAVKTLLGKNREIPIGELWNMGINVPRW